MENSAFKAVAAQVKAFIARESADDPGFNRLALELFALQFDHVPIYREFCLSRAATPDAVVTWSDIPALPTDSFKDFEVTSLASEERAAVFYSSGTTAQDRSRHFHSPDSLAIYEASLEPWFRRHFIPDQTELALLILAPSRNSAPHSSLAYMFDNIARTLPWKTIDTLGRVSAEGAWEVDTDKAFALLQAAEKPVAILGTAFSFVHLLDALPGNLSLPKGSRAMETGGYKGRSRTMPKPELHQLIQRRLGIDSTNIICEYGMSELSSQAYDQVVGNVGGNFHFPPWARTEIVAPETDRVAAEGETGLLRIFDLANVRSVMAVQTADLAARRGTGFELLGRAEAATLRGCSLMPA
jgi:hypothetical protein